MFASLAIFKLANNFLMSVSCASQTQFYYNLEILDSNVPNYVNHLSVEQGNPPSIVFNSKSADSGAINAPS